MQTAPPPSPESFIPCCRRDLIELCIEDNQLLATDVSQFRAFCDIVSAYYHFRFHQTLEIIKASYAPFDPNADMATRFRPVDGQRTAMEAELIHAFQQLLEKANYQLLSRQAIQATLCQQSLVALKTDVDFDDFKRLICYYRGDVEQTIQVKRFFRKRTRPIEVLERVVLLIRFQDDRYFEQKGIDSKTLNFVPGKIYLYFYKDVPKQDLELLFPNVRTSMTWTDRLMLTVPAVGAGVAVLIKILPQLLLIIGVLLFVFDAPTAFDALKANHTDAEDLLPVLVAVLSLLIALGGFGFKQYSNYKSKKIRFQKKVTDALFFRNIANHSAVFQLLVDVAEEEECNEVILAYYHVLTSKEPLTVEGLDQRIERWMLEHLGVVVDFDVPDAVQKMRSLQVETTDGPLQLLSIDRNGYCHVLNLTDAKRLIDTLWDNAFSYST